MCFVRGGLAWSSYQDASCGSRGRSRCDLLTGRVIAATQVGFHFAVLGMTLAVWATARSSRYTAESHAMEGSASFDPAAGAREGETLCPPSPACDAALSFTRHPRPSTPAPSIPSSRQWRCATAFSRNPSLARRERARGAKGAAAAQLTGARQ